MGSEMCIRDRFTAMLISKDRTTSLLTRLGISPMKPIEYILGYMISFIPIILLQNILLFIIAIFLGLQFSINIIWTVLASIIIAVLFIAMGILIGSLVSDKAASGVSSIIIQLVCFTSGMYFPKEMLGDTYAKICEFLPFDSALTITKGILNNSCNITVTIINRAKELMAVLVIFLIYSVINIANIGVAISNTTT